MPQLKLMSSDGLEVEVEEEVIYCSHTIKTMMEELGGGGSECDNQGGDDDVIPLPNVNGEILKKVIEWATYHKDDSPLDEEEESKIRRTDDMSSWDVEFLKVNQATLFDLILAANYLDIKGLLDATCKTVANMIRGKTPEEIRTQFNIKNDFTPAEEEQVRKENEWCEEK